MFLNYYENYNRTEKNKKYMLFIIAVDSVHVIKNKNIINKKRH